MDHTKTTLPEQLKPLVDPMWRLARLLYDPQPGLLTWNSCVHDAAAQLHQELGKLLGKNGGK